MIVPSKASRGDSGKYQSALLTRLQQEGFDTSIELPFTCEELSCWLVKDAAGSLKPDELITAIKVAHFVDADMTPWAQPLTRYLFTDERTWLEQQHIWALLDQVSALDGVIRAVFCSSVMSTEHMLCFAPHEWHPALVHSQAVEGRLHARPELLPSVIGCAHKLSEIQAVSVDITKLDDTPAAECWRTLLRLPELRELEVTVLDDDPDIEAALRQLTRLTKLCMCERSDLPHENCLLHSIAPALPCLQQLRHLELPATPSPSEAGVKQLAAALPRLGSLTAFHTPPYPMLLNVPGLAGVYYAGVASCATLAQLHIKVDEYTEDPHEDSQGAGTLGSMLRALTALSVLKLALCSETEADLQNIVLGAAQLPRLHTLQLGSSEFSRDVCAAWAPQLATMRSLRSLDVRRLAGSAGEAFSSGLVQLTALTYLVVGASGWLPADSSALATALTCLRGLKALRVRGSGAAQDGAAFGAALAAMTQLTSLELNGCGLGMTGGMEQLAAGLGAATTLRCIDLSVNRTLNDVFAAALGPVLPRLSELTSLELRATSISSRGCVAVLQAAAQMPNLRLLSILDHTAVSSVEQALPLLPHLRALPRATTVTLGTAAISEHIRSLLNNALAQRA